MAKSRWVPEMRSFYRLVCCYVSLPVEKSCNDWECYAGNILSKMNEYFGFLNLSNLINWFSHPIVLTISGKTQSPFVCMFVNSCAQINANLNIFKRITRLQKKKEGKKKERSAIIVKINMHTQRERKSRRNEALEHSSLKLFRTGGNRPHLLRWIIALPPLSKHSQ